MVFVAMIRNIIFMIDEKKNGKSDKITKNSNIMDIVMKTVDIMGDKVFEPNLKQSDYNLVVSTDGTGLLDLRKMDMCFE